MLFSARPCPVTRNRPLCKREARLLPFLARLRFPRFPSPQFHDDNNLSLSTCQSRQPSTADGGSITRLETFSPDLQLFNSSSGFPNLQKKTPPNHSLLSQPPSPTASTVAATIYTVHRMYISCSLSPFPLVLASILTVVCLDSHAIFAAPPTRARGRRTDAAIDSPQLTPHHHGLVADSRLSPAAVLGFFLGLTNCQTRAIRQPGRLLPPFPSCKSSHTAFRSCLLSSQPEADALAVGFIFSATLLQALFVHQP
jgi:hypothetical protein